MVRGPPGFRASEIVHVSNELVEICLRLAVPLLRFLYVRDIQFLDRPSLARCYRTYLVFLLPFITFLFVSLGLTLYMFSINVHSP
jgi:hypothetical protein